MSLLMDAPPSLGVLETLEALASRDLSVSESGAALRLAAVAYGRLDGAQALLLAMFNRGNGAAADGATDAAAWLAANTRTSGRDAARSVKRSKVIEALPGLGGALSAGEISFVACRCGRRNRACRVVGEGRFVGG